MGELAVYYYAVAAEGGSRTTKKNVIRHGASLRDVG
jgi:hypothetical protein